MILICATFIYSTIQSVLKPHGTWDAFAIWNLRARFLFRAGSHWQDAFSPLLYWSNVDYPLLLPGVIVRSWNYVGKETLLIPQIISLLFTFSTVGLLFSSLIAFRSKTHAYLAGLLLLGTSPFIKFGSSQCADIPISFFFLAVFTLIAIKSKAGTNYHGIMLLTGLICGLGAWTKNEGLIFLFFFILIRSIVVSRQEGFSSYLKELFPFVLGILPFVTIILFFKTQISPPVKIMLSQHGFSPTFGKLTDPFRYFQIIKLMLEELRYFGKSVLNPFFPLVICLFALKAKIRKEDLATLTTALGVFLSLSSTYFFIYLFNSHDLKWEVSITFIRVFTQFWPSILFIYFMVIRIPEEK